MSYTLGYHCCIIPHLFWISSTFLRWNDQICMHSLRRDLIRLVKFLSFGHYFIAWLAIVSKTSDELWVFHEMQGFKELAGRAPQRGWQECSFPLSCSSKEHSRHWIFPVPWPCDGISCPGAFQAAQPGDCHSCNVQQENNGKCSRTERFSDLTR